MIVNRTIALFCGVLIPVGTLAAVAFIRRAPASSAAVETPALAQIPAPAAPTITYWSNPADFGQPLNQGFRGVTCFRGNAQRNYYGEGPAPRGHVRTLWRAAIGGDPTEPNWNGIGWTGQPLIVEWPREVRRWMNFLTGEGPEREVIVGALDGQVHFFDADTGKRSRKALALKPRNPIKGTVSVDPRGYPLLYVGTGLARSRAGFRVFSLLDFRELLLEPGRRKDAPRRWPSFDSNALVLRDHVFVPGENGIFHDLRLNARWEPDTGALEIAPETSRVWLTSAGVESSLAVWEDYAYCADNRGALWRISLDDPTETKKLRSLGDDADSTITFDDDGSFYVGIEVDRRGRGNGTLYKLRAPEGELVWRWDFPATAGPSRDPMHKINGGILSTPAVWPEGGLVFVTTAHDGKTNRGRLVALDRETGQIRWQLKLRGYSWSSPVVVDGVVVAADSRGSVYLRDAATGETLLEDENGQPREYLDVGGTVESSPVVWEGRIYLGVRGGALVCLGESDD